MDGHQDVIISIGQQAELRMSGDDGDNELIGFIEKYVESEGKINKTNKSDDGSHIKIQKVPKLMLRKNNWKEFYKPKEIAIGPLHAFTKSLKNIDDLKHRLTARFIKESGRDGRTLLEEINKNITQLKECFDLKVLPSSFNEDDKKLARLLFLDGCFVLQFIDSYVKGDIKEFEISSGQAVEIQHDLFLLENQIPFRVLIILMRLSNEGVRLMTNIYHFIYLNSMVPDYFCTTKNIRHNNKNIIEDDELPAHLLDLLRSELLFEDEEPESDHASSTAQEGGSTTDDTLLHYKRSFRNVQDLKEVGIMLKPDYSCGLRSVSFSYPLFIFGQLTLPPLIVDDSTARKLLNLVAYEMCPDNNKKKYSVTSYLRLLDSLIDSEQDVKDLRSAHILRNNLSSDAEVAQLFNTIGSSLVPYDAYLTVKMEIQKHYERKIVAWKAQFYREHFRSPWTILALLAAAAALVLTGIQTYYSVNPKE
ncbi:UPF0481 protein At3g47200-like [Humulus lupulus]|uniref:UPF0481 protein At3g47200-like n=1 Tax=Humulus lupulus TaxID=3486 RepID=UPI002B405A1B|nr:UPF0481 protein At3g47200-like [Humulus lupulus]XP_062078323.1 UPF0481 protein At3g47200-like [Humulus lupulus]